VSRRGVAIAGRLACVALLLVLGACASGSRVGGPPQESVLPRALPETEGVSSLGLLEFLDASEERELGLHSLMIVKDGHVITEAWWEPYRPEDRHTLYSLSKSFTSTAVGLAIEEGFLGLDDRVVDYFDDELPDEVGANLGAMTVRDLLSMSTGHDEDALAGLGLGVLDGEEDWAAMALSQPVPHEPGTHFLYNNAAPYLLSAMVQKRTGQTLMEFLTPRLFEPLGIEGADWEVSPQGIVTGRSGLRLRTEDIAKFGLLYLNRGKWGGKRLLPAWWVDATTSAQVATGDPDSTEGWPDWSQGYGYFFWRCRYGAYRGDGAFGQFCIVLPEEDAVIVMTAENSEMQRTMDAVWEFLLPALRGERSGDLMATETLLARQQGLSLTLGERLWDKDNVGPDVTGRVYEMEPNELGIETVSYIFEGDGWAEVVVTDARGEHRVACGIGEWERGETTLSPAPLFLVTTGTTLGETERVAGIGGWVWDRVFHMRWQFVETGHHDKVYTRFEGDRVWIRFTRSLAGMGEHTDDRPDLVGTAR